MIDHIFTLKKDWSGHKAGEEFKASGGGGLISAIDIDNGTPRKINFEDKEWFEYEQRKVIDD